MPGYDENNFGSLVLIIVTVMVIHAVIHFIGKFW